MFKDMLYVRAKKATHTICTHMHLKKDILVTSGDNYTFISVANRMNATCTDSKHCTTVTECII